MILETFQSKSTKFNCSLVKIVESENINLFHIYYDIFVANNESR